MRAPRPGAAVLTAAARAAALAVAGLGCGAQTAHAAATATDVEPSDAIPWAFAPLLGTGRYEIADDTLVQSLGYAPRKRFRAAALDGAGGRRIGIELRVPLVVSTYRTDLAGLASLSLDDVGTFAIVPGVEIDIPVGERFSVKPLAYAGYGREFHGGPSAAVYWAGIKARTAFARGELDIDLVTSLRYAGFNAGDGDSGDVVPLRAGVEITQPMPDRKLADEPLALYWHAAHTHYVDDDAGHASDPVPRNVNDEWELGISFGKHDGRLRLGFLSWDRVGFAVTLDSGADLSGARLIFNSLYDR